jgi:hypothetical protein
MDDMQPQPVFKVSSPTEVWYCDRPLKASGAKPRKIPVAELEEIIGGGFKYSEDVYIKELSNLPFLKSSLSPDIIKEILTRLKNPLIDKLVICKIDDEVGHGVFARQSIDINEIVAIYSGEFSFSQSGNDASYAMDAVRSQKGSGYSIDAKKIGGIARFFQHLPLLPDVLAVHQTKKFKENGRDCIKKSLDLSETFSGFSPNDIEYCINEVLSNVLHNNGEKIKEMLNCDRDPNQLFEVENAVLAISWHEVAIANVGVATLLLKNGGVPIIYFYAKREIRIGEPVGFSYGLGYWSSLGKLPRLFDLHGNSLSKGLYKYTKMPFNQKLRDTACTFFYEKKQYEEDKAVQSPVKLLITKEKLPLVTMSFFTTRKILAQNNVISMAHFPWQPSYFVLELQKMLPPDVTAEIYERDPDASKLDERYIFDVVCIAPTLQRWVQLSVFIRKDPIVGEYCTSFQQTREIIIRGVNIHPQEMFKFIQSKVDTAEAFFANEIPENLLPNELPRLGK